MTKLPDPPPASSAPLTDRLAQVMAAVDRVPKRGRNEHFRYDYATEADIMDAVRSELAARGVAVVPRVESMSWREVAGQRGVQHVCTLIVDFAFRCAVGSEQQEQVVRVVGEGMDSGDKAAYKAMTGAAKYALLKTFLISTGDDPERDADHDHAPAPAPSAAPARAAAPAPASAGAPSPALAPGMIPVSPLSRQITAKLPGRPCPGCGKPIVAGDRIWYAKGEPIVHVACGSQGFADLPDAPPDEWGPPADE